METPKYKYIKSYTSTFIEFPDSPFFLRHATKINYAGKVYTVIRGIESNIGFCNNQNHLAG